MAPGLGTDTNNALSGPNGNCYLGEVILCAGSSCPGLTANGQILQISQYAGLFAVIGITYGGNGTSTFALPNLSAIAPNHMTYAVCADGQYPSIY